MEIVFWGTDETTVCAFIFRKQIFVMTLLRFQIQFSFKHMFL